MIPKIAIAPIIFIWFGLGTPSRLIVVVLLSFFPVVIASVAGLKSIEPNKLLPGALGRRRRAADVRPVPDPERVARDLRRTQAGATRAVGGAIIAEFLTPGPGLGRSIYLATSELRPDVALAGIAYLVVIGLGFFFLVAAIERLVIPWHVSVRGSGQTQKA